MRTRGGLGLRALYLIVFCKILANLPPLPSEGSGEAFYKQLDIPSVVAMAVSTEIITLRIVFHFSFFILFDFLNLLIF